MANTYVVDSKKVQDFISKLYEKAGMPKDQAEFHAYGLVNASLRGVDSHGVLRTKAYLSRILNKAINVHPNFKFEEKAKALYILDADKASGYTSSKAGMQKAIELAKEFGIGAVIVKNSNHFGAAALYSQMAVDEGMIGYAATNVKPGITAPGAAGNVVGNNPFAIGIPTYLETPFMLDMALSVVAGGKLKMAIAKGEKIPLTWATDKSGNPTDDPQLGFDGYLLPLGGFKGLGLAYSIDIMCGLLSGGAFQNHIKNMFKDPNDSSNTCHMFMATDVSTLMSKDDIRKNMQEYRDYIQSIPTVSGQKLVFPGEIEYQTFKERSANGIPLPEAIYNELVGLAKEYSIDVKF